MRERFTKVTLDNPEVVAEISKVLGQLDRVLWRGSEYLLWASKLMQKKGDGVALFLPTGMVSVSGDMLYEAHYKSIDVPDLTTNPEPGIVVSVAIRDGLEPDDVNPVVLRMAGLETDDRVRIIRVENPNGTGPLSRLVNGLIFYPNMRPEVEQFGLDPTVWGEDATPVLESMTIHIHRFGPMVRETQFSRSGRTRLMPTVTGISLVGEGRLRVEVDGGNLVSKKTCLFNGVVGANGEMAALGRGGKTIFNGLGVVEAYSKRDYVQTGLLDELLRYFSFFDEALDDHMSSLASRSR